MSSFPIAANRQLLRFENLADGKFEPSNAPTHEIDLHNLIFDMWNAINPEVKLSDYVLMETNLSGTWDWATMQSQRLHWSTHDDANPSFEKSKLKKDTDPKMLTLEPQRIRTFFILYAAEEDAGAILQ